jgi:hypothetical protein
MSAKTNSHPTATASDRDLIITRIINAPREKVFKAWTDPELLKQWFAPLPYTTPIAELDVRPGGANLIVMRDPQGNDLPNRGVYLEVVENERIVGPVHRSARGARGVVMKRRQTPFLALLQSGALFGGLPRVTQSLHPWAKSCNAFGVNGP